MRKRKYTSIKSKHHECFTNQIEEWQAYINGGADAELRDSKSSSAKICPVIHNLVGTCVLQASELPLNLRLISDVLPNSHFDKQKFAAITLRLATPACTVLLFTSGKMVLTGSKTYLDCRLAAKHVCLMLKQAFPGMQFSLAPINIQNIVGNVDLNLSEHQFVDLQQINNEHDIVCTYQKNMFPGLILRPVKSRIVLLIFNSGKIVLTGAKCTKDLMEEWNVFENIVLKYVKSIK